MLAPVPSLYLPCFSLLLSKTSLGEGKDKLGRISDIRTFSVPSHVLGVVKNISKCTPWSLNSLVKRR